MNELVTQKGFDYSTLPTGKAEKAKAAADRIQVCMMRTVEGIIEVGRELTEQKKALGHGNFLPWIEAEFAMSSSAADRFMQSHKRFGSKLPKLGNLNCSIIYELAAPSTPDEVVDEVTAKAANGKAVSLKDVKELKKQRTRAPTKSKSPPKTSANPSDSMPPKKTTTTMKKVDQVFSDLGEEGSKRVLGDQASKLGLRVVKKEDAKMIAKIAGQDPLSIVKQFWPELSPQQKSNFVAWADIGTHVEPSDSGSDPEDPLAIPEIFKRAPETLKPLKR